MSHLSVFKKNQSEKGYLQVIINKDDLKDMEDMGFVNHIDKLKKSSKKKSYDNKK